MDATTNVSASAPPRPARSLCRHCQGLRTEPAPLRPEFARRGKHRGDLTRMAKSIGITPSYLHRILSGESTPSIVTLLKMARYFGTTVDRVIAIPAIWARVQERSAAE